MPCTGNHEPILYARELGPANERVNHEEPVTRSVILGRRLLCGRTARNSVFKPPNLFLRGQALVNFRDFHQHRRQGLELIAEHENNATRQRREDKANDASGQ